LMFLRALKRDSVPYLLASGGMALLAIASHVTAVLAPLSFWIVLAFLYLRHIQGENEWSERIVRIGFWLGILAALLVLPLLFKVLVGWSSAVHGWEKHPAQLIFEYYREAGLLFLLSMYSLWIFYKSRTQFYSLYLGTTIFLPVVIAIAASPFTNIRADYGISFLVPAVVATAIALHSIWRNPHQGRELSVVLMLALLADASPRLVTHYTDRLAEYSRNATKYLLEQHRPGDRFAVFVPGVNYYLAKKVAAVERDGTLTIVERDGLGNPHSRSGPWPPENRLSPTDERLWLAFRVTRDDLAPPVLKWLIQRRARLAWRQYSPRFDSQIRGVEIFLICPPSQDDCAANAVD